MRIFGMGAPLRMMENYCGRRLFILAAYPGDGKQSDAWPAVPGSGILPRRTNTPGPAKKY